jgi:phosphoenolpyruvate synthase/pyruvate phosphate dikinase
MLARGAVVVRSSAIGEDSVGHSFAGQLDSFLNVTNEARARTRVLECWASYWSERALFYRRARGAADAGMGVIIQQQVRARGAGVLFTDAGNGSMLVEYTAGLGDALVSGAINPGRLSIARDMSSVRHEARPPHGGADLLDNAIEALFSAGTKLEQDLGGPQDIEWALDHKGRAVPRAIASEHGASDDPASERSVGRRQAVRVVERQHQRKLSGPGLTTPLLDRVGRIHALLPESGASVRQRVGWRSRGDRHQIIGCTPGACTTT